MMQMVVIDNRHTRRLSEAVILILVPPSTLISEADVMQLAALLQFDLLHGDVLGHRREVRVD